MTGSTRIKAHTCPYCYTENDGALSYRHPNLPALVGPGDVAICFYCAGVAVFTETGAVRRPTPAEDVELAHDVELADAVARVRAHLAQRGR